MTTFIISPSSQHHLLLWQCTDIRLRHRQLEPAQLGVYQRITRPGIHGVRLRRRAGFGRIFGCAPNAGRDGFELNTYTFDIQSTNAYRENIASVSTHLGALAFDKEGQLYGIDQGGVLYKVDNASGATTTVGNTSVTPKTDGAYVDYIHSSATIDPASGIMYWSVTSQDDNICSLYEVDLTNASVSKIRDFAPGIEVTGLYIGEPEAAPGAPSAPTEVSLLFEGTSLSGFIEFKAPAQHAPETTSRRTSSSVSWPMTPRLPATASTPRPPRHGQSPCLRPATTSSRFHAQTPPVKARPPKSPVVSAWQPPQPQKSRLKPPLRHTAHM